MLTKEQRANRSELFGASEFIYFAGNKPNPFKTPLEFCLEKSGHIEREKVDNLYTEIGNIMEKIIQKSYFIKNMDHAEFEREGIVGHIDGLTQNGELVEIKCISGGYKKALNAYMPQIRMYMYLTDIPIAKLIVVNRKKIDKLQEIVDDILMRYSNSEGFVQNVHFDRMPIEKAQEIKDELKFRINNIPIIEIINATEIGTLERDLKDEANLLYRYKIISEFVDSLKHEVFFDTENEKMMKRREIELCKKTTWF